MKVSNGVRWDEYAQGTISWDWERDGIWYFPFGALKLVEKLSSRGLSGLCAEREVPYAISLLNLTLFHERPQPGARD